MPALLFKPSPPSALRDEVSRQLSVLKGENWVRLGLTMFAYVLSTAFIPVWIALSCGVINLLADLVCVRDLGAYVRKGRTANYRRALVMVAVMEVAFCTSAGAVWMSQNEYAKAFAIGLVATTLIHVATVRSINLASGLVGLVSVTAVMVATAALYWLPSGQWHLFLVGLCATGGTLSYCATAVYATHTLHRATAEGRAEAQAANEAKGKFLAQISHELRTPLNAILGLSQTGQVRTSDPQLRDTLAVITDSARGLSVILDDILDMSALRMGQLPLRPAKASPHAVIDDTVTLFRPLALGCGTTILATLDATVPQWAIFDPNRFRQCLSNLISNAIKHTRSGKIRLAVRYAKGQLIVEISDTGPGIPPDRQCSIFEPFNQAASDVPGNGLGLAISRDLARQMQGDLVLQSTAPGRTVFCLSIGIAPAPIEADTALPAPTFPDLTGHKVLIVDDIATNRLVAASHLRLFRADLVEASSGLQALEQVRQGGISLVLLDVNMPGMDGNATLQAIRAQTAGLPHLPIIAMTALSPDADGMPTFLDAVDGLVTKPLTTEAMAMAITNALEQRE